MKRTLLFLVLLMLGLSYVVWTSDQRYVAEKQTNQVLYPDLPSKINTVTRIILTSGADTGILERGKAGWVLPDLKNFPADSARVRSLLLALSKLQILEQKTALKENHSVLALTVAAASRIDLYTTDAKKPTWSLLVGKQDDTAENVFFVRKTVEDQVWLVRGNLNFARNPKDWLQRELLDVDQERVATVTLQHGDGEVVKVGRDTPYALKFSLLNPPSGKKLSNQLSADALGSVLAILNLRDVMPRAQLKAVQPLSTAQVVTFDGMHVTIDLFQQDKDTWATLKAVYQEPATKSADWEKSKPQDAPRPLAFTDTADVKARVDTLNSLAKDWAFRFEDFKINRLKTPMAELTDIKDTLR